MKTILVTGSKGYIGSHIVHSLEEKGYFVIGIDNYCNSGINIVKDNSIFYEGDIRDDNFLEMVMSENNIDMIIHLAALVSVPQSFLFSKEYMEVNFFGTKNIIEKAKRYKIHNIIFSSTAAVYGIPDKVPINEMSPTLPISPYGKSKLKSEEAIRQSDMGNIIFRYANVGGSFGEGLGYFPKNGSTHLIPIINDKFANDSGKFIIYGDDYKTKDGTCIRDYVHMSDLVEAHLIAIDKLINRKDTLSEIYNISTGKGCSVIEVLKAATTVHKRNLNIAKHSRREGDPAKIVLDPKKIHDELGWKAKKGIEEIIMSDYYSRYEK